MSGGSVSYNKAVIGEKNLLGGGIYFSNSNGSNNQLSITGGEIKNNCSKDSGGGIQITTGLTVSIANCTIQGNSCGAQGSGTVANGGGIQANPGVVLNLLDCVITDNKSITGHGGGVHISGPNKMRVELQRFQGQLPFRIINLLWLGPICMLRLSHQRWI